MGTGSGAIGGGACPHSCLPHILIDTNYWKSFVHARLATAPGDRGVLTLYGTKRTNHALFAQHVAGSETSALTHGHNPDCVGNRPTCRRPLNGRLTVIAVVAASMQGDRPKGDRAGER